MISRTDLLIFTASRTVVKDPSFICLFVPFICFIQIHQLSESFLLWAFHWIHDFILFKDFNNYLCSIMLIFSSWHFLTRYYFCCWPANFLSYCQVISPCPTQQLFFGICLWLLHQFSFWLFSNFQIFHISPTFTSVPNHLWIIS